MGHRDKAIGARARGQAAAVRVVRKNIVYTRLCKKANRVEGPDEGVEDL